MSNNIIGYEVATRDRLNSQILKFISLKLVKTRR